MEKDEAKKCEASPRQNQYLKNSTQVFRTSKRTTTSGKKKTAKLASERAKTQRTNEEETESLKSWIPPQCLKIKHFAANAKCNERAAQKKGNEWVENGRSKIIKKKESSEKCWMCGWILICSFFLETLYVVFFATWMVKNIAFCGQLANRNRLLMLVWSCWTQKWVFSRFWASEALIQKCRRLRRRSLDVSVHRLSSFSRVM